MRSKPARLAVWLGVFAVVLRSVIGSGVMPDPKAAAQGQLELVICTGSSALAPPGDPHNDDEGHRDGGACAFSAFTHLAAALGGAVLAASVFEPVLSAPAPAWPLLAVAIHRIGARAPPARA